MSGPGPFPWGLAFSPGGDRVAVSEGTPAVRLWDAGTGAALETLSGPGPSPRVASSGQFEGHAHDVRRLVYSPDGGTLASVAAGEPSLRLSDVATGRLPHELKGH